MQSCDEAKIDSENRVPGDFYWHEDWQPPSLWRRVLICAEAYAGNEDITGRKSAR